MKKVAAALAVLACAFIMPSGASADTWELSTNQFDEAVWLAASPDNPAEGAETIGGFGYALNSNSYATLKGAYLGNVQGTPLPVGRGGAAGVYDPANDSVYVIGGSNLAHPTPLFGSVYHRAWNIFGTWDLVAPLPVPRTQLAAAAAPDGRIFAMGGYELVGGKYPAVDDVAIYDPVANSWTTGPVMNTPTGEPAAATGPDGKIYAAGGWSDLDGPLRDLEVLDPNNLAAGWQQMAPMPAPHDLAGAGFAGGKLYVIGGWDGFTDTRRVDVYDPATDTWSCTVPMSKGRSGASFGVGGNVLSAIGGVSGRYLLNSTERFPLIYLPTGDTAPPVVSAAPAPHIATGQQPTSGAWFVVNWSVSDQRTDILDQDFAYSNDGGANWGAVTGGWPTQRPAYFHLGAINNIRYRVTPKDGAGNVAPAATGIGFSTRVPSESVAARLAGTWHTVSLAGSQGGHVKYATGAGAKVRYAFHGREIAWIAPKGPTRGSARVYIDGHLSQTVNLHATSVQNRLLVYRHAFTAVGSHTIMIQVVGTKGHARVDVDGFAVIGAPIAGSGKVSPHVRFTSMHMYARGSTRRALPGMQR